MKGIVNICLILAAMSFIIGLISRLTVVPVGPMGLEAEAFLQFTNTCLLVAILVLVKK